jgi:hypothetical protein
MNEKQPESKTIDKYRSPSHLQFSGFPSRLLAAFRRQLQRELRRTDLASMASIRCHAQSQRDLEEEQFENSRKSSRGDFKHLPCHCLGMFFKFAVASSTNSGTISMPSTRTCSFAASSSAQK